uniref:Uncharacterized protein n=1 Tax=Anguilla anguilla TaxID=7936 RepID=A0A0E9TI66_ANGAN
MNTISIQMAFFILWETVRGFIKG